MMHNSFSSESVLPLCHQVFLYCSCQYTKQAFIYLFKQSFVPVHVIPVETPDDITLYNDVQGRRLLVITGHDDSLRYSARAAWFELCWKQNVLTSSIMCVHMYSRRSFSYRKGNFDFPSYGPVRRIRQHITNLLNEVTPQYIPVSQSVTLTPREKELMFFISEGLSVRDIAGRMDVSEKTVLNIRMTIIKKMGLKNRNYLHRINFTHDKKQSINQSVE